MFKKIQNYLLINHPLIWNTKVVPFSILLIIINIVFFLIGYITNSLNFDENEQSYLYENEMIVNFFAVLLSVLLLILWLAFYFKNNSFKSFYPRNSFSLFKEWIITLFISFLICLFITSFYFGKDVKMRTYFSEIETLKRCKILSMGSFFVDGSFSNNYNDTQAAVTEVTTIDDSINNYFVFNTKKYSYNSLLNKNLNSYTCFNQKLDSIHKNQIKNWLVNQQKDSIKLLLKKYLDIAKEHNLKANIDENKWFELLYDYPKFESDKIIGNNYIGEYYYLDNYNNEDYKFDSINKYIKTVNKQQFEFYKYYVPEKNLNYNYTKISNAWNSPTINFETFLISIYFALGLSLLIFSFRVTSGKNWLKTILVIGVFNILFGIISAVFSYQLTYPILLLVLLLCTSIYFVVITNKQKNKKLSAITLNCTIWLLPSCIPLLYYIILESCKNIAIFDTYSIDYHKHKLYQTIKFLEDNNFNMAYLNLIIIMLIMLLLTTKIKKWKGISEN